MIETKVRVQDEMPAVEQKLKKEAYANIRHAAASIRKTAMASIERSPKNDPSPAGSPPHSRRGLLRRAIVFSATNFLAIIGPRGSVAGKGVGGAHEFGGAFRENQYPERPFMAPALEENTDRFASGWSGSI